MRSFIATSARCWMRCSATRRLSGFTQQSLDEYSAGANNELDGGLLLPRFALSLGDQHYLDRIERLQRTQMIPRGRQSDREFPRTGAPAAPGCARPGAASHPPFVFSMPCALSRLLCLWHFSAQCERRERHPDPALPSLFSVSSTSSIAKASTPRTSCKLLSTVFRDESPGFARRSLCPIRASGGIRPGRVRRRGSSTRTRASRTVASCYCAWSRNGRRRGRSFLPRLP